jgi:hypothetical protein
VAIILPEGVDGPEKSPLREIAGGIAGRRVVLSAGEKLSWPERVTWQGPFSTAAFRISLIGNEL